MAAWAGPCAVRAVAKLSWSAGACVFEFFLYDHHNFCVFSTIIFISPHEHHHHHDYHHYHQE